MVFKIPVNCPFCEKEVIEDWANYIVDQEKDHGEVENTIECDEIEYPHCHELFNVFGSIYEAPKGTYSYHELSAEPIQE